MAYGLRVRSEAVREAAFGTIGAAYTAVGSATTHRGRIVSFYNSTDVDVYITTDLSKNEKRLASGTGQIFDYTANKVRDDGAFLPEGTIFYVKRVSGAPSSGAVWVQYEYCDGGI
jgi:hypothetical protein